jgi:thiol-disulfide isomerase/thioredoxin
LLLIGFLSFAAAHNVSRPTAEPPPRVTTLRQITYAELAAGVKALKGQVVVVDFWADYCPPCKREFPRLVALHRQHSQSGLTTISVSLDDPNDAMAVERVQRFLGKQEATCVNYLLNEKPEVWQAKLKIEGPPCVFIFNRRGELLDVYRGEVDYSEVEKLVAAALKE